MKRKKFWPWGSKSTKAVKNKPTLQDLQDLQELESRLLRGIKTVESRAHECVPGTRTSILADIASKIDENRDGPNTIWIQGAPGSGKSSISLTAKSQLYSQGRLITYFRFDRNEPSTTTPTSLWRHVAYDLARRIPSLRPHLLTQLRDDRVDLNSTLTVFASLVEGPLSKLTDTPAKCPFVIVIDAVDECGGLAGHLSQDRRILLQTLRRWHQLPSHFKLLLTSRPENDITRVLSSISIIIEIPSGHILTENPEAKASIDSYNDIRLFLEYRFETTRQNFPSLPVDWPGSQMVDNMIRRAAGIFMWVTAAANFIDQGLDPRRRLRDIMDNTSDSMEPLFSLYAIVLEIAFGKLPSGGVESKLLRSVLGTIVLAKRPLEDVEYTTLPTIEPITADILDGIRNGLRSVIAPDCLRFVHKSFDDFLLSNNCPPKYAVKKDESHHLLTKLCLTTMTERLHFNLCGLETSCLENEDIPNIEAKVSNGIPPLLSYSCCFFADHLSSTLFDQHLMAQVEGLIMDKLLYWFEAMSLLKEMNRVSHSLLLILKWSHLSPNEEFRDYLHDARRFVGAFVHPIAQSAPHVYLSALPFAPECSLVAKRYLPQFPGTLALSTGRPTHWSSCNFTSERHESGVCSVTFSPDEKHFASGSFDGTICVYDSETGNLISGPFKRDSAGIPRVCFDPDGRRIWASYFKGDVICWDIQTGHNDHVFHTSGEYTPFLCLNDNQKVISASDTTIAVWSAETGSCEVHLGHTYDTRLVSISPDACYVALAEHDDGVIRIWRVVEGIDIQGPYEAPPLFKHADLVTALSFSIDGSFAVSGSADGIILVWDATTGNVVGRPLDTKTRLSAVAFSPANNLLVSASSETCAAMVWNSTTHEAMLGPLEGHAYAIFEISLSRNGLRALTGSDDTTVRMWDLSAKGAVPATQENEGNVFQIWYAAFSKSGKFGTVDRRRIRIWDVDCPNQPLLKLNNREYMYRRIIFSPDGNLVVAYNSLDGDGGVGVWDAETGGLVFRCRMSDGRSAELVSFRSTGQQLITCSPDNIIRIWNLQDGKMTEVASAPNPQPFKDDKPFRILALSPDGSTAVVEDEGRVPRHYMWSTTMHQPIPFIPVDDDDIAEWPQTTEWSQTTFSPSGQLFAFSLPPDYNQIQVWNTQTGEFVTRALLPHGAARQRLAFSPNDQYIAIGSGSHVTAIWIFDIRAGCLSSGPWNGHTEAISSLAFSPDGEKLLSSSHDCQIRLWTTADLTGNSQVSVGLFGGGEYLTGGWVKDVEGKLMFWVPNDHRARLVWPQSVLFGVGRVTTELDLSRFKYGDNWTECFPEEA